MHVSQPDKVETLKLPALKHSQVILVTFTVDRLEPESISGLYYDYWPLLLSEFVVRQRPLLAGGGSNDEMKKENKKHQTKFVKTPIKM